MKTYFISGHLDVDEDFFNKYYLEKILDAIDEGASFVVGDAPGIDTLSQKYLFKILTEKELKERVTIYHMFDKPRYICSDVIKCVGGFKNDKSRDEAMTKK